MFVEYLANARRMNLGKVLSNRWTVTPTQLVFPRSTPSRAQEGFSLIVEYSARPKLKLEFAGVEALFAHVRSIDSRDALVHPSLSFFQADQRRRLISLTFIDSDCSFFDQTNVDLEAPRCFDVQNQRADVNRAAFNGANCMTNKNFK